MRMLIALMVFFAATEIRAQEIPSYCELEAAEVVDIARTENYLVQKLERCLRNHIFQRTQKYFQHSFSEKEGAFTYFKTTPTGQPAYSDRRFKTTEGEFFYLRKGASNDQTFFSTREFTTTEGKFLYLRKHKEANVIVSSVREFTQAAGKYVYFRKGTENDKTVCSTKVFVESEDHYVYFRIGKEDQKTILSLKNGSFRNSKKEPMTAQAFHAQLRAEFWQPLVATLIFPALELIDSGF